MEIITSAQNEWVARARKLKQKKYRDESGLFLAEGLRLSEEAVRAGLVEEIYYHETLTDSERGAAFLHEAAASGPRFIKVSARVIEALAETEAPQGVVCVCAQRQSAFKDFLPGAGTVVVADTIRDPGNLGSILRTLWAAGGQGLICLRGSTDPYGGKCVRASMGGLFRLPVFTDIDWPTAARWAFDRGYTVVAADTTGGADYRDLQWPERTLLCIGGEATGLVTIPAQDIAQRVSIPLAEGAESLNAAIAASILIYEARR